MKLFVSFKLKPGYEYIKSGVVKEGDFVFFPSSSNPEYSVWHPALGLIGSLVKRGIVVGTNKPNTWLACRKTFAPKEGCEFVKKGDFVKLGDFVTDDTFWRPAAGLVNHKVGANGRVKSGDFYKLKDKWYVCRPIPVASVPEPMEGYEIVNSGEVKRKDYLWISDTDLWTPAHDSVGAKIVDGLIDMCCGRKTRVCRRKESPASKTVKITVEIEGKCHSFSVPI